ncbi:MAG TPA: EscU/YscU/HrcU family type III secretion system export apparatus switch protein [Actinomycetes bacterium]|nr:EscU/YscU/HrcU family type III secretion system export apparatus switch protein [Actinomycetes bacterium]
MSASGAGGGEKTEKPTPKKLKDARKEGQVRRTPDVGAWAGILAAVMIFPPLLGHVGEQVSTLLVRAVALVHDPAPGPAVALLGDGLLDAVISSLLLGAPLLVIALATNIAQDGLHVASKKLKPDLKRLNPLEGFKRIAGPQALWELVKALLRSAVVGLLVWQAVAGLVPVLVASGHLPLSAVLEALGDSLVSLLRGGAAAGLIMALADYFVVRRRVGKQLKMSHQEIKEEMKQTEGDPHVKGAIRSRQLAMSRNRMISDVAEADVVLVNPTHVAVALRYDPARGAPRVVAKGAGAIAARIREEAGVHRVPMVADIPLARALYRACEVGTEIPPELFTAVARVLAFVLSLRSRGSAAGLHHLPVAATAAPR